MASFLDVLVADTANLRSTMRIPITTQTPAADVVTYATSVLEDGFGAGAPMLGAVVSVNLVITDIVPAQSAIGACTVNSLWQATMRDQATDIFRFGLPTRNPADSLLTDGEGIQAATGVIGWTTLLATLRNALGTVHMVNGETNSLVAGWGPVLSSGRARKRPRTGGIR